MKSLRTTEAWARGFREYSRKAAKCGVSSWRHRLLSSASDIGDIDLVCWTDPHQMSHLSAEGRRVVVDRHHPVDLCASSLCGFSSLGDAPLCVRLSRPPLKAHNSPSWSNRSLLHSCRERSGTDRARSSWTFGGTVGLVCETLLKQWWTRACSGRERAHPLGQNLLTAPRRARC